MESLLQDIRDGLRGLARNPVFTIAVVLTLALGIGANTAIFTLIDATMFRLLPVQDPAQLYLLGSRTSMSMIKADNPGERSDSYLSYPLYRKLRDHSTVFSDLAAISSFYINAYEEPDPVSSGMAVEKAEAWLVSGNFFSVLGVDALLGRTFTNEDDSVPGGHPVALVSHGYWTRRFGGDPSIVGREIRMNGVAYTILGVTNPDFSGVTPGLSPDIWVPVMMQSQLMRAPSCLGDVNTLWLRSIGRLKQGVVPSQAADRTRALFHQLLKEEAGSEVSPEVERTISRLQMELVPFGRGMEGLRERLARPLYTLMVVVALVLLIACANVGNLLLARASGRRREVSLRLALGSGRYRLLRQFLIESLMLALAGGIVALLASMWTTDLLWALFFQRALELRLNSHIVGFALLISLLTAVVFGLAPALQSTRVNLTLSLRNQGGSAAGRKEGGRLRSSLVIAQVAIALLLLIAAGLFVRSMQNLYSEETGFRAEGVLLVELDPQGGGYTPEKLPQLCKELMERVRGIPGVESVSMSYYGPFAGAQRHNEVTIHSYSPRSPEDLRFQDTFVTPGYFETMGIPILLGRAFRPEDREGSPRVAIVNQAFARHYFGDESPLGKRFGVDGEGSADDMEIVGVVTDLKYNDLREQTPRYAYYPAFQQVSYLNSLELRTSRDPLQIAPRVRTAIAEADKNLPVLEVTTLTGQIRRTLRDNRMISQLAGFFGLVALFLACLGLYGVMAYGVARRTGEIGVRLALGANRRQVVWMVLRSTLKLVVAGILIGIPGALVATRFASSLLFGLKSTDPLTLLTATTILLLVAILAGYIPARRASRLDPASALRGE